MFNSDNLAEQLFKSGVLSELVKAQYLPAGQVSATQIEKVRSEAIKDFLQERTDMVNAQDAVTAIVAFSEWIKHWEGPTSEVNVTTISVSIAFPMGRSTVTFSADGILVEGADKKSDMSSAHEELFSRLAISIEDFIKARKNAPSVPGSAEHYQPPQGQSNGSDPKPPVGEYWADAFGYNKVMSKQNKPYMMVITAEHPKGVFAKTQDVVASGIMTLEDFNRGTIGFNPMSFKALIGPGDKGKPEAKEFRK